MIEPLTAFALAGNIVQFVEVGYKATVILRQIWDASATDENVEIEAIAQDIVDISMFLAASSSSVGPVSQDEKKLQQLARRCVDPAEELSTMLQDLLVRSKGMKRRIEAVRNTLKLMYRRDKIESLQHRIQDLRDQLCTRMIFSLHNQKSEVFQKLEDIIEASRKVDIHTSEQLRETRKEVRILFEHQKQQAKDTKFSLQSTAVSQQDMQLVLSRIETLSQQAAVTKTSTEILKSLRFSRMHDRHSTIHERHQQTFSWIFEASASPFKTWLAEGSGAFWVSGKAGSGKSTLMKYINNSPTTMNLLRTWSEARQLITASFYFWNTGTEMQKSQEGLLQSILYEILRHEPNLIPTVLPSRWQQDELFHQHPPPWKLAELYEALDVLIQAKPAACFCFFIDGLDEYSGDAGEQGQFAEQILKLSQSKAVKICVASRPWLQFGNVFGQCKQRMLTLESLTRRDMEIYVRDLLQRDPKFAALLVRQPRAIDLVHDIQDKARGVFLWVVLVVKSLRSGLTLNDSLEDLRRRLDLLPADLEEFFRRMIDTIDENYKLYACRILCLARSAAPLPLRTIYWVPLESTEENYAINTPVKSDIGTGRQIETARNVLNKWTKDLLEVYHSDKDSSSGRNIANLQIGFIHRTVGDFLSEPEVRQILEAESGEGFDPNLSMCRVLLAEAKSVTHGSRESDLDGFYEIAGRAMCHARLYETQHQRGLTELLRGLDNVISSRTSGPSSAHWTASLKVSHPSKVARHRATVSNESSNFVAYATSNNLVEFVRETLNSLPKAVHKRGRPLLDFAIYPTFSNHTQAQSPKNDGYSVDMIALLLERGALADQHAGGLGVMTAWQMFLLDICTSSRSNQSFDKSGAWQVAQSFLKHRADRQVKIPLAKIVADISVEGNFGVEITREYERTTTPVSQNAWVILSNPNTSKNFWRDYLKLRLERGQFGGHGHGGPRRWDTSVRANMSSGFQGPKRLPDVRFVEWGISAVAQQ